MDDGNRVGSFRVPPIEHEVLEACHPQSSFFTLPYRIHEGLHSMTGDPVVVPYRLSLLDDIPSLGPGDILLLAQVLWW